MDKTKKFEAVVKYLKNEIDYNQLGDVLVGEKDIDFFNEDNYQKYKQEKMELLKDSEFYQYLIDNDCLVSAMKEFADTDILSYYLNIRNIQSDEEAIERKQLLDAIVSLPDKAKLDILNCMEEEEGDYGDIIYNPITSRMDDEVLKNIILSLSEEERIKFLINPINRDLHFTRIKNDEDKIEIFNSLTEEDKLRIFSEYTTITYEDWTYKFIPFIEYTGISDGLYGILVKENLNNNSKMAILKNEENKYDYILDILRNSHFPILRNSHFHNKVCLIDMILDLNTEQKLEILRNSKKEYDTLLQILSKNGIQEIIFSIEFINDEVIDLLNEYLLNEPDDKKIILAEKLKRIGSIDGRVLSAYRFELIDYLQNESDEKIQFLEENLRRLKNINEDILDTCELKMLTEEYKDLSTKLDVITCDSKVQKKILNLSDNSYQILVKALDIVEKDNIKDWIPIIDNFLEGLNNKKYKDLLESIENSELTDEETIRKLIYILSSSENIFDIKSIEEVENFNRVEYVEKIKRRELKTKYISSLDEIEKLQLCVLEKKYGQSIEESIRLLKTYGKDIDEFELSDERDVKIKEYLESIRNILNTYDKRTLEELYNSNENLKDNYLFSNIIESEIRAYFARQLNEELYQLKDENKININLPLAQGIPIYDSGENFMIELTSLGAYSNYNVNANFYEEWNRKLIQSHGFCTTPIANNNIATAKIEYVTFGFNNFAENSLLLSAPWDIVSSRANKEMNTSQSIKDGRILYNIPHKQIDNIRHTHPENVRERRALDKGNVYKKQPAYIVYIPVIPLEKYMELQRQGKLNDRNERNKLLIEYTKNDKIWENSVRASRDFSIETDNGEIKPLPIVIIDRTYIAIKEKEKIDDLERKFRETGNPDLINRIIVDSENNRTGNTFCDEIRNTLFSPQILQDRIARIEKIIQELETRDKQTAKKCIQMLINTTLEEEQKYECFGYNKTLKTERGYNHNEYINRWIEEYNRPDDIVEFREQCLGKDGKQQVAKIVKEIEEMPEYRDEGIHSKRHIQNVVLFTYMIANKENKLDDECKYLLLEAAKYHDSGRNEEFHNGRRVDGKEEHAKYSTRVAERSLREQGLEKSKIAMVNVAILYHEHNEKNINEFDEKEFQKMCLLFGVKEEDIKNTRLMCKYLKDADALDRTRFQGRASLNPRYLRTDTAKSLIGEARRINERYRELDKQNEKKSVIHIIDEDELKENNDRVSEKERREATEVLNEIIKNKEEKEFSDNG